MIFPVARPWLWRKAQHSVANEARPSDGLEKGRERGGRVQCTGHGPTAGDELCATTGAPNSLVAKHKPRPNM